jgi:hypothetical protein
MKVLRKWFAMLFRRLVLPTAESEKKQATDQSIDREPEQRSLEFADRKHHRQMKFVEAEERELDRRIDEIRRYVSASRG